MKQFETELKIDLPHVKRPAECTPLIAVTKVDLQTIALDF